MNAVEALNLCKSTGQPVAAVCWSDVEYYKRWPQLHFGGRVSFARWDEEEGCFWFVQLDGKTMKKVETPMRLAFTNELLGPWVAVTLLTAPVVIEAELSEEEREEEEKWLVKNKK